MLIAASALNGYAIQASDGSIAKVGDLLFDDVSWNLRWIVAETGSWLTERKLLLHPWGIRKVDHEGEMLVTVLTKAQLEASPPILEHEPVSRQVEARLTAYYGSDALWGDGIFGAEVPTPPVWRLPSEAEWEHEESDSQDPHLRSVAEVKTYHIHATDGMIGHVENLLVDDATWDIRFFIVDTRNWWPGQHVLVPPASVREIDYVSGEIRLSLDRDQVKAALAWDPFAMIDQVYARSLPSREGWRRVGF